MLLMYSILNWSSGLASGTGGIKVLIADTIVYKKEGGKNTQNNHKHGEKKKQSVNPCNNQ